MVRLSEPVEHIVRADQDEVMEKSPVLLAYGTSTTAIMQRLSGERQICVRATPPWHLRRWRVQLSRQYRL